MSYRQADHPIAADRAAVHFYLFQTVGQASEMLQSVAAQRYIEVTRLARGAPEQTRAQLAERKKAKKAIQKRYYPAASGLWNLPHAVSLTDPFTTACGTPYLGGCQVPSIWEGWPGDYSETRWFELLDIRGKCLGCAGAIGADPSV